MWFKHQPHPLIKPCHQLAVQDIARYINATKGDYEGMKQIEDVEQSLVEYKGPPLTTCGNYHLDGELRIKGVDGGTTKRLTSSIVKIVSVL